MASGTYEYTFLVDRGLGYDIQKYVLANRTALQEIEIVSLQ